MKKLIIILYLAGLTACGSSQSALPYHQGLQRELTYDNAINSLETFTVKSAKEDGRGLKQELKDHEKQNSENAKRKKIEQENAELRKKLEELKKSNQ